MSANTAPNCRHGRHPAHCSPQRRRRRRGVAIVGITFVAATAIAACAKPDGELPRTVISEVFSHAVPGR